jgi:hypothetical protein
MPSAVPVSPEESVLLTRACEQLPVTNVQDEIGRSPSDDDTIAALRTVAKRLGISATELDARIWDFMQSQGAKNTRWACR